MQTIFKLFKQLLSAIGTDDWPCSYLFISAIVFVSVTFVSCLYFFFSKKKDTTVLWLLDVVKSAFLLIIPVLYLLYTINYCNTPLNKLITIIDSITNEPVKNVPIEIVDGSGNIITKTKSNELGKLSLSIPYQIKAGKIIFYHPYYQDTIINYTIKCWDIKADTLVKIKAYIKKIIISLEDEVTEMPITDAHVTFGSSTQDFKFKPMLPDGKWELILTRDTLFTLQVNTDNYKPFSRHYSILDTPGEKPAIILERK